MIGVIWTTNSFTQPVYREKGCCNVLYLDEAGVEQLPKEFYLFTPVFNNPGQTQRIVPITYVVSTVQKEVFLQNLQTGMYYCSFLPVEEDSVTTTNLYKEYTIIQLIKKKHDGYIGYLEELVNVPFVLPPRWLYEGHQIDLRLGVDCAEMAIYGRRRQGYRIPYCGPQRLMEYCETVDAIEQGTIISFGNNYQISVLYEDRGIIGKLDEEDILIHAFEDKAEIVALKDTKLKNYPYKLYRWKE